VKYCPNCGNTYPDDCYLCSNCNRFLENRNDGRSKNAQPVMHSVTLYNSNQSGNTNVQSRATAPQSGAEKKKRKPWKSCCLVNLCVFLFLAAIVGVCIVAAIIDDSESENTVSSYSDTVSTAESETNEAQVSKGTYIKCAKQALRDYYDEVEVSGGNILEYELYFDGERVVDTDEYGRAIVRMETDISYAMSTEHFVIYIVVWNCDAKTNKCEYAKYWIGYYTEGLEESPDFPSVIDKTKEVVSWGNPIE